MADLLRMGYTMLNMACPVCNNPIFQNKSGDKFCPSCDRKVLVVNEKTTKSYQNNDISSKNKPSINVNLRNAVYTSLEDVISKKIQWIIEKLYDETDIELLGSYVDLISNFLNLLNKINPTPKRIKNEFF
ncbi:MAG: Sjogren's syndrome/scleroderma autoantigen 1 family protein [Candidatus Hodarchaeales archaeon]|jgi:uncharacterized Zn finger protein (UPF0148 family)